MAESLVIARRFRPKLFDEVIGQEAITRTLRNSITSNRIHHAYLFTGVRGVGKTTTARILAKCLNCHKGITIEPCGVCPSCVEIDSATPKEALTLNNRVLDVLEIDAASNTGVDNVRSVIIDGITIKPSRDRYRIFIIDEVHMLSGSAFNALLKTLEEPPPHVVFIMATTELHKVPDTILSRCQVFEFRTISVKRIFDQLRMIAADLGIEISDSALLAIARAGDGSMRDAESALDQVISFAGKVVSDEDVSAALGLVDLETINTLVGAVGDQDARRVLSIVEEIASRGYDLRNLCRDLMTHFRALLVVKVAGFDQELLQMPPGEGETLVRLAEAFSEQDILRFFTILTKTEQDIRTSSQPRFQLEMGLMKLVHARRLYLLEEALNRVQEIESRLNGAGAGTTLPTPKTSQPATPSGGGTVKGLASPRTSPPSTAQVPVKKPEVSNPATIMPGPVEPPPTPLVEAPTVEKLLVKDEPETASEILPADPPDAVARIKKIIEERRKMLLLSALDQSDTIEIDGGYLCVSFPQEKAMFKSQLESRDNKKLLEEIGRMVVGRALTLSVSVGGKVKPAEKPPTDEKPKPKPKAENHPMVRAIKDRFHGEVVEIIDPDR